MARIEGALSGELGLVGLLDLTRLLLFNRATGRLALERDGARAALLFRDGRLVNAVDEDLREGEDAACKVLAWKQGRFDFRSEPVPPGNAIAGSTEALVLEAARRQDRAGAPSGGETGAEARARDHRSAIDALRDVFPDLTRDARRGDAPAAVGGGMPGDALSRAGDRLVLRPGRPARLRVRGVWRDARDGVLTPAEYIELKIRLLGSAGAREAASGERPTRITSMPGGRAASVTLLAPGAEEALWLRPVHLPAPEPLGTSRGLETLAPVLGLPQAVLVVGGLDADATRELTHALAAELHTRSEDCLLIVREFPVYRHPDRAGVLAECGPGELSAGLVTAQPQTLVLDLDQPLSDDSLLGLDAVQRVIARVPGASAAAITSSWRVRLGRRDHERFATHTAGWPTFLVTSPADAREPGAAPIEVWQLPNGSLAPGARSPLRRATDSVSGPRTRAA